MQSAARNFTTEDRAYLDGHRFMFGELASTSRQRRILFRDRLMRPGFVLPVIRLAPVAPYGSCMALSGNGGLCAMPRASAVGSGSTCTRNGTARGGWTARSTK